MLFLVARVMQDGGWNPWILLGDRDVDGRMILK